MSDSAWSCSTPSGFLFILTASPPLFPLANYPCHSPPLWTIFYLFFTPSFHLSSHCSSSPPLPVCWYPPSLRGFLQLNAYQPWGCYVKLSASLSLFPISHSLKAKNTPVFCRTLKQNQGGPDKTDTSVVSHFKRCFIDKKKKHVYVAFVVLNQFVDDPLLPFDGNRARSLSFHISFHLHMLILPPIEIMPENCKGDCG